MNVRCGIAVVVGLAVGPVVRGADEPSGPDFARGISPIFARYCTSCHNVEDAEGELVLETHAALIKGGESGPAVVPGKSGQSRLVQLIERSRKPFMPPGKRKRPTGDEIALIKAWIDAGARASGGPAQAPTEPAIPKITPTAPVRRSIAAVAFAPDGKWIALARHGEVELVSPTRHTVVHTLSGHRGHVNALAFSADGKWLAAAGGEPGQFGEVRLWNVANRTLERTFEGHRDSVYAVALSPDGTTLATGSYDQRIKLWNVESGDEIRTLTGHNGAVFGLAFRPDGMLLASASDDRTVKLWDVATGTRRDTFSESLKTLHAVAFSPDGKRLAAGGVDNRIRVWQVSDDGKEGSNPILYSRFAHEGAILELTYGKSGEVLVSSADDRTVKVWNADTLTERFLLEVQPDWPTGLGLGPDDKTLVVGRLDGTFAFYDAQNGKPLAPPKPTLARAEPRGVQRGVPTRVRLVGKNLSDPRDVSFSDARLHGRLVDAETWSEEAVWVEVTAADALPRGSYDVSLVTAAGKTEPVKLVIDDLVQVVEAEPNDVVSAATAGTLPVSFWGTIGQLGDVDHFGFDARAGQQLVFDVAAQRLGSKANAVLTVFDPQGRVVATNNDFDGDVDPLLMLTATMDGTYVARVAEQALGSSANHFYRLSVGEFAYVTGRFPLGVAANTDADIELIGFNLPDAATVSVQASAAGEVTLKLDERKLRWRRDLKVIVGDGAEDVEVEPNDQPKQATPIAAPGAIGGRIRAASADASSDVDLFRFESKAGQRWMIETQAAQLGTPMDPRIEVLRLDGTPVPRLLLQAVRNSNITFRPISSTTADARVTHWEEMDLNQFVYMQGEVCKIFRMPLGPDSGIRFYTAANGQRRCYFDTSATAHALEEPCYIVEPHAPGTSLVPNGLPVFAIPFANDDDGERRFGRDACLAFTAPSDGAYLIRVSDVRGYGGQRYVYRLAVRRAKPDFTVKLEGRSPTINAGSGRSFTISIERADGFDGPVTVEIAGLPDGISATSPLVIEAGHRQAKGTLFADAGADVKRKYETGPIRITATGQVDGETVTKSVDGFASIQVAEAPKLRVWLEPMGDAAGPDPAELILVPGRTISARLRIERNGHDDLVTFSVENLPHGVIVDNIGLSGVLIPKGRNQREIFLTAAAWVRETSRPCYAVANQAGKPTSSPVLLHVRGAASTERAAAD